jgi:hypothetical protein
MRVELLLRNHTGGRGSVWWSGGCLRLPVSYEDVKVPAELTFDITMDDSMFMKEPKGNQDFPYDQADMILSQRLSSRLQISPNTS